MWRTLQECSTSRYPLLALLESEIKDRISATRLGVLWWILDPLLLLAIYVFIVHIVFGRGGPGYPLFVFTGIVIWQAAAKGITQAASTFTRNSVLIRAYNTPLFIYVAAPALSGMFYAAFGLILLILINIRTIGLHTLALFPLCVLLFLMTLALSLPIACLGAWFKDVNLGIGYLLRIAFYATPVLYGPDMLRNLSNIPSWVKNVLLANPLGYVIDMFRKILLEGQTPSWATFALWSAATLLGVQAGILLLRKAHNTIPKVI